MERICSQLHIGFPRCGHNTVLRWYEGAIASASSVNSLFNHLDLLPNPLSPKSDERQISPCNITA